ncbi:hypothetical protein F5146DRAFT_995637 [Armillaria mellea]|nr:hypothetical protein F5146DRAFT_995637 [Armillaria mellea]
MSGPLVLLRSISSYQPSNLVSQYWAENSSLLKGKDLLILLVFVLCTWKGDFIQSGTEVAKGVVVPHAGFDVSPSECPGCSPIGAKGVQGMGSRDLESYILTSSDMQTHMSSGSFGIRELESDAELGAGGLWGIMINWGGVERASWTGMRLLESKLEPSLAKLSLALNALLPEAIGLIWRQSITTVLYSFSEEFPPYWETLLKNAIPGPNNIPKTPTPKLKEWPSTATEEHGRNLWALFRSPSLPLYSLYEPTIPDYILIHNEYDTQMRVPHPNWPYRPLNNPTAILYFCQFSSDNESSNTETTLPVAPELMQQEDDDSFNTNGPDYEWPSLLPVDQQLLRQF